MTTPDIDALWCIHLQGSDEYDAMESREAADQYAEQLDAYDRQTAERFGSNGAYLKAVVVPWPFDAASHAQELAETEDA